MDGRRPAQVAARARNPGHAACQVRTVAGAAGIQVLLRGSDMPRRKPVRRVHVGFRVVERGRVGIAAPGKGDQHEREHACDSQFCPYR